jgi:FlaA1/EpsC-like NDP-sugar epimerase
VDIAIEFTGLRPGKKLHEELIGEDEARATTPHDRIKVLQANGAPPVLGEWLPVIEAAVAASDVGAVVRTIQTLVPAYTPSASLRAAAATTSSEPVPAAMADPSLLVA